MGGGYDWLDIRLKWYFERGLNPITFWIPDTDIWEIMFDLYVIFFLKKKGSEHPRPYQWLGENLNFMS